MTLDDQPPVPGGTTAIRGGKYVREERAPGPVVPPMTDTERLAALLHDCAVGCTDLYGHEPHGEGHRVHAARLAAAGVRVGIDPDRLARADYAVHEASRPPALPFDENPENYRQWWIDHAKAVVKAYEEER